jgi:uncharacterized protein YbaP (TraB family)
MTKCKWIWLFLLPFNLLLSQSLTPSLLWEISGKGLSKSSYLFGTIHMIPSKDFNLSSKLNEAFDKSDLVVFEIDLNEMTDFSSLLPLMMKSFMPDQKLSELVTQEEYLMIEDYFEKKGLPIILLERIKPMFLYALLSGDMFADATSYEVQLWEKANNLNKKTKGLETAEFQMSIFDSIPYPVQAKLLVQSIKDQRNNEDEFENMIQLYKQEDIEKLYDLITKETQDLGSFNELMVFGRNRNWIPQIENMMMQGSVFFAVGAGHLAGKEGLIELLKNKGYTLKPLKQKTK